MSLVMLLFWGSVVWLVVAFIGRGAEGNPGSSRPIEDMLAQRFARGEIDAAQYQQRLWILREGRSPHGVEPVRPDSAGASR